MRTIGAAEAAHILGVSRATVTRAVQDGRLPLAGRLNDRPTGALLFDANIVEDLAAERKPVAS